MGNKKRDKSIDNISTIIDNKNAKIKSQSIVINNYYTTTPKSSVIHKSISKIYNECRFDKKINFSKDLIVYLVK